MNATDAAAVIDAYLLGERKDRDRVFEELARLQTENPAALTLLRAIRMVGSRAADESLMALRVALTRGETSDDDVRAVRSAVSELRGGVSDARERYLHAVGAA